MKSIRERAETQAVNLYLNPDVYNEDRAEGYKHGYTNGAAEQKQIDDEECQQMVGAAAAEASQVTVNKVCELLKAAGILDEESEQRFRTMMSGHGEPDPKQLSSSIRKRLIAVACDWARSCIHEIEYEVKKNKDMSCFELEELVDDLQKTMEGAQ